VVVFGWVFSGYLLLSVPFVLHARGLTHPSLLGCCAGRGGVLRGRQESRELRAKRKLDLSSFVTAVAHSARKARGRSDCTAPQSPPTPRASSSTSFPRPGSLTQPSDLPTAPRGTHQHRTESLCRPSGPRALRVTWQKARLPPPARRTRSPLQCGRRGGASGAGSPVAPECRDAKGYHCTAARSLARRQRLAPPRTAPPACRLNLGLIRVCCPRPAARPPCAPALARTPATLWSDNQSRP
jgi:hypothetical protein